MSSSSLRLLALTLASVLHAQGSRPEEARTILTARATPAGQASHGASRSTSALAQLWPARTRGPRYPNVLVLVADDLGVDKLRCYGESTSAPPTPNLDALAAAGVLFRNAYSYPSCSPTRAAALTGRHGFRTGIGTTIKPFEDPRTFGLPDEEVTLAELLELGQPGRYDSAAVGKWHLSSASSGGHAHPNLQGFQHFSGPIQNLLPPETYERWTKTVDGRTYPVERYATSEQVDDALAWIEGRVRPWFLWLSFNAPHAPLHEPPHELHGLDAAFPCGCQVLRYHAAIQALDTEIGRLFATLEPEVLRDTYVVFLGDNGTLTFAVAPPFDPSGAKGTLAEGGINVPFLVAGPGVVAPGRECAELVSITDLFASVAELAGIDAPGLLRDRRLDSVSFVPYLRHPDAPAQRRYVYAEQFSPNGHGPYEANAVTLRTLDWKLIRRRGSGDELYRMTGRFKEGPDLLADGHLNPRQSRAYTTLLNDLTTLRQYGVAHQLRVHSQSVPHQHATRQSYGVAAAALLTAR